MSPIGFLVFFSPVPAILALFATLPPRRAAVMATISCWLFLPVAGIALPGMPDYTKSSALTLGLTLAMCVFDSGGLLTLRPRWYDLAVVIWCLAPLASSLSNGLGAYDGTAGMVKGIVLWGLPYLVGRVYFGSEAGLRELAVGLVTGGMIYALLCLLEIRISPQLHRVLYGFSQQGMNMNYRWGGYRPLVFMLTGLEVGMYMAASSLVAYGLWAAGTIRLVRNWRIGPVAAGLAVVTVLCKSVGAIGLMSLGLGALWMARRTSSKRVLWALVIAAPLYVAVRTSGAWDGQSLVNFVATYVAKDRSLSLAFRLENEERVVDKVMKARPVFGWAGYNRSHVIDDRGRDLTVLDGLWVIALAQHGLVGLTSITALQVLPLALFLTRQKGRAWLSPELGPAACLAVLLGLYSIDNVFNAMYNPIYVLAMGGLMGLAPVTVRAAGPDWAARGRALKSRGRPGEAASSWRRALEALGTAADGPSRGLRGDLHNDLAWLLCADPRSEAHDPASAVASARDAVEAGPDHAPYWNTLGLALLRAGDPDGALGALERSVALGGGTAFDFYAQALAHAARGDLALATTCRQGAEDWARDHSPAPHPPDLLLLAAEATAATRPPGPLATSTGTKPHA